MNRIKALACAALLSISAVSSFAADPGAYKIDLSHSSIIYNVGHMGLSNVYGRFNDFSGTINVADADAKNVTVQLAIKTDSIDTGNQRRDGHLKSPDFFNTKQFPEITFKSTKVTKSGEKTYDVTGDMTMMGQTKPVSFTFNLIGTAKDPRSGKAKAGGEAQFTIKRSEFGMKSSQGLADEVKVAVAIEAGIE